jgi:hypothetical protein
VPGGDHLLRWLPLLGLPLYLAALYLPPAANFFELEPLDATRWCWVAGFVGIAWIAAWLADVSVRALSVSEGVERITPPSRSGL